jgi:hypothetical protein
MTKPDAIRMRKGRLAAAFLLMVCIALSATGVMMSGLNAVGLKDLHGANDRYLQNSFDKTLKTFGVLSAVKVGLAVMQGSDVGIGFHLEVGDIVQSVYDYVDIAWRTTLGCAAVLLGTRYLLQTADLLAPWFLTATFAFLLLHLAFRWTAAKIEILHSISRDLAWGAGIAAVTLILVLPASIAGGRWLSTQITQPSIQEAQDGLLGIRKEIESSSVQAHAGFLSKLVQAKDRLTRVAEIVSREASKLSVWVLKLIAGYVFDCFVFPVLLFLSLFWLVRKSARYLQEAKSSRRFRHDLETVLGRAHLFERPRVQKENPEGQ